MFSSGGPSVRFLTRYDGEVSEAGEFFPTRATWEAPNIFTHVLKNILKDIHYIISMTRQEIICG